MSAVPWVGAALVLLAVLSVAAGGLGQASAEGTHPSVGAEPVNYTEGALGTEGVLAEALLSHLEVWRKPSGERVFIAHCRAVDCGGRAREFARYFVTAAGRYNVDPWLLAAMAVHESGLNPDAEGGVGERGVLQLHPRGVGHHVRFVTDERYRRGCLDEVGACQAEVVDAGAHHLSAWALRCGNMTSALNGYNSGRCSLTHGYAERVVRRRAALRGAGR